MSENFWDTVDTEPEVGTKPQSVTPATPEPVFASNDVESPFVGQRQSESIEKYDASLADFPVAVWDSKNDAKEIISWFNGERFKQGKETLDFQYFRRATNISEFNSRHDAQTFLDLALGILNEEIPIDREIQYGGWMQDANPQWMEEYEESAGMWANIAAAVGFTFVLVFFMVATTLVSIALIHESERQDWPTGEAQVVEFEEWVETSCGDDGCSDTQYAKATFQLHCLSPSSEGAVSSEYVCGGDETENTVMFEHEYNSGFFEHAPVAYMMEQLTGAETHTVAYNPVNPSEVDLRPGFQINWEWFVPVVIPLFILLVITKAENVSVKSGYASLVGIMKGEVEV